jgi:PAS domain-containing protein
MESGHFFLFVADVEGKVIRFNRGFERINSNPLDLNFSNFLSSRSEKEFNYSLELMLGSPKIRRHLMLEHPVLRGSGFSQVWWEFSVVTTQDMDISGIIGIGVGMQLLEQDMPWNNLVDVLGFGEVVLDEELRIKAWDERILNWVDPKKENWTGKSVMDIFSFQEFNHINEMLSQLNFGDKPRCFLINRTNPEREVYAALMTVSSTGYHLFLMPKPIPIPSKPEKSLISQQMFRLFPGAVFVLGKNGKLIQQNDAAKNVGRVWKGRAYSEGFLFHFPDQPKRFSKLLKGIEDAKSGQDSELELKLLSSDNEFIFWNAVIKPILNELDQVEGVLIQVVETTAEKAQLIKVRRENERLRDLALSPSHVLRGPLSSMMGIIELFDLKQLDKENQKLFGYLKPLTKELDSIIRHHSKKVSTFI